MMFLGWVAHRGPSVAVLIGFTAQASIERFVSSRASALYTLLFDFKPGDAAGTQGIGIGSAEVYWLHRHSLDLF